MRHLVSATAGEQRDEALRGIEPVPGERLFARRGHPHAIEQRVPYEDDPRIVAVDRGLERKQHREAIDAPQDLPHAAAPPRPDLWTHVVEDGDTAALGNRGER